MAGQVVIVNGTSGSGKSTTCERLATRSDRFWLLYGIDHFLASTFPRRFGHHGPRCREGIYAHPVDDNDPDGPLRWSLGPQGLRAFGVFHEWVAAASRQGSDIVLDHLLLADPPLLQDCIWRLQGLPVLLVTLKPPVEALLERVATRNIGGRFATSRYSTEQVARSRQRLERLGPWFYQAVYANRLSDLEIDTGQCTPDAVCDLIEARLAAGPGTAFEQLRLQYPQAPSCPGGPA